MWPFRRKTPAPASPPAAPREPGAFMFSTHSPALSTERAEARLMQVRQELARQPVGGTIAMDGATSGAFLSRGVDGVISSELADWFLSAGFIGYQMCAAVSQNWLVNKACTIPARDAVRHGFDVVVKSKDETRNKEIADKIAESDVKLKLTEDLVEFVRMGRIFGIRVGFFDFAVANRDEFYKNPFNIDAVEPGTYRGISQVDPYWMSPILDVEASSNAASQSFFEPTWWAIQGKEYHRSHLVIFRNCEVPDILKPSYFYGGISVPQLIMERVYAAERTANEGPLLAMTKRTMVWGTDLETIASNQAKFETSMAAWMRYRDNYGVKVVSRDDSTVMHDTGLADVDTVTMTQYQLVAAAANVPVTKLLGTSPKGFNSTGEYDEANYHEELESLQANDLTPLLLRHHELVWRSLVQPEYFPEVPADSVKIEHDWHPVDSPTAKEYAEINAINADTDSKLQAAGAIDGDDIRKRLDKDRDSGYAGMLADSGAPSAADLDAANAVIEGVIAEAANRGAV